MDAPMFLQIHGGVGALETIHTPCAGNNRAPPAGGPTHACTQCIALRHWPTAGPNGCWSLRYSTAIPGTHPLPAIRSQGVWIVSRRGYIQRLAQRLGPAVPTAWIKTYRLAQSLPWRPAVRLTSAPFGADAVVEAGLVHPHLFKFVSSVCHTPFLLAEKKSAH